MSKWNHTNPVHKVVMSIDTFVPHARRDIRTNYYLIFACIHDPLNFFRTYWFLEFTIFFSFLFSSLVRVFKSTLNQEKACSHSPQFDCPLWTVRSHEYRKQYYYSCHNTFLFSGCSSLCQSHSCEHDISRTLFKNFLQTVHKCPGMNWFNFRGQKSKDRATSRLMNWYL